MCSRLTMLALAMLGFACGPGWPDDKAPPSFTTNDSTTTSTDPTSGTEGGSTTKIATSTTAPAMTDTTSDMTGTTAPTTGGDSTSTTSTTGSMQCLPKICDDAVCPSGTTCTPLGAFLLCVDPQTTKPVCASTCPCLVDFDCGAPGLVWCTAEGQCVDNEGASMCPDGGATTGATTSA